MEPKGSSLSSQQSSISPPPEPDETDQSPPSSAEVMNACSLPQLTYMPSRQRIYLYGMALG